MWIDIHSYSAFSAFACSSSYCDIAISPMWNLAELLYTCPGCRQTFDKEDMLRFCSEEYVDQTQVHFQRLHDLNLNREERVMSQVISALFTGMVHTNVLLPLHTYVYVYEVYLYVYALDICICICMCICICICMTWLNYIFVCSMWKSSLQLFRNYHFKVLLCIHKALVTIDMHMYMYMYWIMHMYMYMYIYWIIYMYIYWIMHIYICICTR